MPPQILSLMKKGHVLTFGKLVHTIHLNQVELVQKCILGPAQSWILRP